MEQEKELKRNGELVLLVEPSLKIGFSQRRLAWPLRKVDKLNREVSNFFFFIFSYSTKKMWIED